MFEGVDPYPCAVPPNEGQIAFWATSAGARWVAAQESLDAMLGPLGQVMLDRAGPQSGERAIDVGCGCGDTTLELARRVGPGGEVLGVDVSAPMLAKATARATESGIANLAFDCMDAQTAALPPAYNLVVSRFGVMFFDDPVAAFANLRSALEPGGRITFACWQEFDRNRWMALPLEIAERHCGPAERAAPGEPGPFAFADPDVVRGVLTAAGFSLIAVAADETPLVLGADIDAAVQIAQLTGPSSALLGSAPEDVRERAIADIRSTLAEHLTDDGVCLAGAAWIVSARCGK